LRPGRAPALHFRGAVLLALVLFLPGLTGCGSETPEPQVERPKPVPEVKVKPGPAKVTHFYPADETAQAGEEVTVCYGVENAGTVLLEPGGEELRPSRNRCISVAPRKTQVYKLTARGADSEDTAELTIKVEEAAPRAPERMLITTFVASDQTVSKGAPVTLCYGLDGAESVKIDPPVAELEPVSRCFSLRVTETTTFRLTATGGGRTDEHDLVVTVR